MKYAIFSDIHNHTAALEAMLANAQSRGVDTYYCLGDVGIDACAELVQSVGAVTVFGNWEASSWRTLAEKNQKWALSLPPMVKRDDFWLTHAAPFWPPKIKTLADLNMNRHFHASHKLFPYLHYDEESLWKTIATLTEVGIPLMFHGHTHRQIVWRFTGNNHLQRLVKESITLHPGDTLVVGVGSVGRPLDGPGASYVIFDDDTQTVEMVRVGN